MSADADKRGNLAVRWGSHKRPQRGTPRAVERRPVVKRYGAKARYAMTKFERERIARREATLARGMVPEENSGRPWLWVHETPRAGAPSTLGGATPEHPGTSHSPRRGVPAPPNAAPTAVPAGPFSWGPAGDQPEDRTP